ncbi:MAG: redox-regulated ATPase YchF [Chloroflexi bacterium]|nr:redox-regulated ATPase YchF [Chloroflexota bacterium]
MQLGLIGLPQSGKTTVFNALTGSRIPLTMSTGRVEVHTAVVKVPDPRVDALAERFGSRKRTYATITYADIAGLSGKATGELPGALRNILQQMDALVHVVRAFPNPAVPHPLGHVAPQRDVDLLEQELLLHDLMTVERRLARIQEERQKGARPKEVLAREEAVFQRLYDALSQDIPLRAVALSAEEERLLRGFGLLTRKPLLILLNLDDEGDPPEIVLPHPERTKVAWLRGRLEMELAQLDPEDAAYFREEFGLTETGQARLIRLSYELLDRITFYTVGEKEARAWSLPRGSTALDAAAAIHTDLAKGFIRAEVIPFDELMALGDWATARGQGKIRLEGKDYVIQDGDVILIRFGT